MPSYQDALDLFHEWTKTNSLRRHAYGVEAAMAFYAEFFKEDVEIWRITGLLHDMDYEKHPTLDKHPYVGVEVLREKGYPNDILQAIMGHADHTGVSRKTLMAKTLFAVDELSGFIGAVALVRPTRLEGMKVKSVRKKLKDKAFAAAVNRNDILQGAEELEIDLSIHITNVIEAMRRDAERLAY